MKLNDEIEGYWLDRRSELALTTQKTYSLTFEHLIEYLKNPEFTNITAADIRRFFDHLAKQHKLSKRSVHDAWVILSSLWTWAEKEHGCVHVIRQIDRPKFQKPAIEPLTEDESRDMIKAAEYTEYTRQGRNGGKTTKSKRPTAARDTAIIRTLLDCGLRAQELCSLVISDYEQKSGRLHIRHGKGNKSRYVFLGDRARKSIWRYLVERKRYKSNDPLFSTKTGAPMERNNLRHTLRIIAQRAGVVDVHPHRFRHTFAIQFLRNNGNVFNLQRILGHSDLKTVLVYIRLAECDLEKAGREQSPVDNWQL